MDWLYKFFDKKKRKTIKKDGFLSNIKDLMKDIGPLKDLSAKREEEILNNIAKKVLNFGMETPAVFFLKIYDPLAVMTSQLFLLPIAPFLEFVGVPGYDYTSLFMKQGNLERLLNKIEEGAKKG